MSKTLATRTKSNDDNIEIQELILEVIRKKQLFHQKNDEMLDKLGKVL